MRGNAADSLAAFFLNLLYPAACPGCGAEPRNFRVSPVCRTCWTCMDAFPGKPCQVCSRLLKAEHADTCGECLKEMPP